MDLKEIYLKLMPLNKEVNKVVSSENYILFKKFLTYFCLDSRLKRNALPAYYNIKDIIKINTGLINELIS